MPRGIRWIVVTAVVACAETGGRADTSAAVTTAVPDATTPVGSAAPTHSASSANSANPTGEPRDIPAQPIHWDQRAFGAFMGSRANAQIGSPPPPPVVASAVRSVPTLRSAPVVRYGVEGALLEAYMLGDPLTSLRALRDVQRLTPPPAVAFTSNNMLVVAYDTTPGIAQVRRVLVADTSRSGRLPRDPR